MFLVGVEANFNNGGIDEWWRNGEKVTHRHVDFQSWMLHKDNTFLQGRGTWLNGGVYRRLIEFDSWGNMGEARSLLRDKNDAICYYAPDKQYLTFQDYRMFGNAKFSDIKRLVFDIETTGLEPTNSKILIISWCTNWGKEGTIVGEEWQILKEFKETILREDPDCIEGYNIVSFDLPFVLERSKRCSVQFRIGRDNSIPYIGRERPMRIGANSRNYKPVYIKGRHVVDDMFSTMKHDIAPQKFSSYGLKPVARGFGVSFGDDRIEVDRSRMEELFNENEDEIIEYARQDVLECLRVGDIVLPADFYQTQILPMSFQTCLTTGTGTKIDSLLVHKYLDKGYGIPSPQPQQPYEGGYVECKRIGVFHNIIKADVESLYPSLMIKYEIAPKSDTLGVMLPLLSTFKAERLLNKRLSKDVSLTKETREYHNGLQEAQKILINSFYGYLGSFTSNFNDYDGASEVTRRGREIVQQISEYAEEYYGCKTIEIDTDGVIMSTQEPMGLLEEEGLISLLDNSLPDGIKLAHDGRYQTMVSIKGKNYVLVDYDGKFYYKGNSLKSRATEPFGLQFLKDIVSFIIQEDKESIFRLYTNTLTKIVKKEMVWDDIRRRERITEATKTSPMKKRLNAITELLSVGDHVFVYEKTDGSLGTLEDDFCSCEDYNVLYYCEKVYKFVMRLETLFTEEELKLFPKPGKRWLANFEKVVC